MEDAAVRSYLNKVYANYEQSKRGCSTCSTDDLDIALHCIVAFTQYDTEEWTQEGHFNVLSSYDVGEIFDNSNRI